MIQRIQTIYLFLSTILSTLFFKGTIFSFSDLGGSVTKVTFSGILRSTDLINISLPITILLILIPLLSVLAIFLFKRRNLQLLTGKVLIALITVFIIVLSIYIYTVTSKFNAEISLKFKMAIPVIQLILCFLAYRGIKKDDDLVKSYDRLR
jgi:hypothetical protein